MKRQSGILCAVSSLPGTLGIGDFGHDAYLFVDMLEESGAKIWQILPLNPVGYGNSPYQTYSSFAGDEIYISIEHLYESMGLSLDLMPIYSNKAEYEKARKLKTKLLKGAFKHFKKDSGYKAFLKKATWLDEYAEFMALRVANKDTTWTEWTIKKADSEAIEYQKFVQYIFYTQWQDLKAYANEKGIEVMGDIPIYLGHDSAEVYFKRELFYLDKDGKPTLVAGVPPDYFSNEGQLWGNPIYNWDKLKKTKYDFWVDRLKWNQDLFDTIRIDHFRAFDTYWAIPGDSKTAKNGEWRIGPRNDFFDEMYKRIEDLKLVVEDLGDLRPEVLELRDDYGLMGMQIIQFALKPEEIERDKSMDENILAYTGTHDNQPIGGWREDMPLRDRLRVRRQLGKMGFKDKNIIDRICHYSLSLNASLVILPLQDILRLGNESQMNRPGTVGSPNWEWKLRDFSTIDEGLERYRNWLKQTDRL